MDSQVLCNCYVGNELEKVESFCFAKFEEVYV